MKKAISLVLSVVLAISLVMSMSLVGVSAAENEVGGVTVISREFLVNLFEKP